MISFEVPKGEGYIIGDLLHKYAVRGSPSWQVAAYYTGERPENMGLGENACGSVLDFLGNVLVCEDDAPKGKDGSTMCVDFKWEGTCYRSGPFTLEGLAKQQDTLTALLVFSFGQRTSKQNFGLIEGYAHGDEVRAWYAVPTRHVSTGAFRYRVETRAEGDEWLTITADSAAIQSAYESALSSLESIRDSIS